MVKDPTCDDADRQKIEQVESLPFILTSSEVGMRDLNNDIIKSIMCLLPNRHLLEMLL